MLIGLGIPANVPGTPPAALLEWARRADAGPFSTVATIDRIAYDSYEPLAVLAAAAAVTTRVRLMTSVLLAPLRNAGVLAKQAATVDALAGGRLTLGFGVGSRADDFEIAPASMKGRGKRFDGQLELMRRIWSGQVLAAESRPVGPAPVRQGGPEILIGGSAPQALARVGRWGDGYLSGGGNDPERARRTREAVLASWQENGRSGSPRFVTSLPFVLGPDGAVERGRAQQRDYYSWMPESAEIRAASLLASAQAIRDALAGYEAMGYDEVILQPTVADLDLIDRAAELVG